MLKLTPKQEKFAALIAGGMDQTNAYRESHDVKPTTKMLSIAQNASKLAALPHVAARIAEIRKPVIDKLGAEARITLESHLQKLADLRDAAEKDGKYDAAVKAEIARGKAAGIVVEKKEMTLKTAEPVKSLTDFYQQPPAQEP